MHRILTIAALVLISGLQLNAQPEKTVAYGMAVTPSAADKLSEIPAVIRLVIESVQKDGNQSLISDCDHHAVLPVRFDAARRVLSDLEGAKDCFYNVTTSSLVDSDDSGVYRHIDASYEFLGIGQTYSYIEEISVPEDNRTEYMIRSVLADSIDKKLNEYEGCWYIRRLPDSPDGSPRTYARLSSRIVYNDPFFLQDLILKLFAGFEVNSMFAEVKAAALKLDP